MEHEDEKFLMKTAKWVTFDFKFVAVKTVILSTVHNKNEPGISKMKFYASREYGFLND